MASNWELPARVIPIATIEATFTGFFDILKMTRCPNKFIRWQPKIVEKSFKWADAVEKLQSSIDPVQLQLAVSKLKVIAVSFIDEKPIDAVLFPYTALIRAILTSPLFSMCSERGNILIACVRESSARLGSAAAKKIFVEMDFKKTSSDHVFTQILSLDKRKRTYGEFDKHDQPLPTDDLLLAAQMIEACCQCKETVDKSENKFLPLSLINSIAATVRTDSRVLRLLCIGLSLSPCTLFCACVPRNNRNPNTFTPNLSTSNSHNDSTSTEYSDMEINQPANVDISVDDFNDMMKSDQLWRIIIDQMKANILPFLKFDNNFTIFQNLREKNSEFAMASVDALITATTTFLKDTESQLREIDEGKYFYHILHPEIHKFVFVNNLIFVNFNYIFHFLFYQRLWVS